LFQRHWDGSFWLYEGGTPDLDTTAGADLAGMTLLDPFPKVGGLLQGSIGGDYDTNAIHFFAVNLIWKF